jgi:hypothetical protein
MVAILTPQAEELSNEHGIELRPEIRWLGHRSQSQPDLLYPRVRQTLLLASLKGIPADWHRYLWIVG